MSYETEQAQLKRKVEELNVKIKELECHFQLYPAEKRKLYGRFSESMERPLLEMRAHDLGIFDSSNDSDLYLTYRILVSLRSRYMCRLKESKTERNIGKAIDFVDSITPKQVSGRLYRVENMDGCLLTWLVFAIFGLIFLMMVGVLKIE